MPRPSLRGKGWRFVRLPGGKKALRFYKKRKKLTSYCSICHNIISITSHKKPKTKKRPERIYGGFICSSCLRKLLKKASRAG